MKAIIKKQIPKRKNNINLKEEIILLKKEYEKNKPLIQKRLLEFKKLRLERNDFRLFQELVFCLLTPQSKAKSSWKAVNNLTTKGLLLSDNHSLIAQELSVVRFKNNKANYIIEARKKYYKNNIFLLKDFLFSKISDFEKREFLVTNIKGYGLKEASHFLRNIGFFDNLAILDRHILKNLLKYEVITEFYKSISKKDYLFIEKLMKDFALSVNIPIGHLDLLFWYKQTGEVFK